jgi:signal transduction histidine kinase
LSALLLGGLAGALAASRMSLWALRPLHALSAELRTMRAEEPKPALSTRAEDEPLEVAQIRAALTDLLARIALLLDPARRFAVDAAHELRTPLTTIRGELDLLIEDTTDAKARAGLERVSEHLLHLSELVERLLLLALPLAEERTSDETVALSDVIEEVIGRLPSALRARVRTTIEVEGLVRGEPRLLAALVRNALDNALKYSEGTVDVTLREGERSVVIEVSDRGPGIAKELRERVFESFVRLGRRDAQGHGLGLPLIAHLVRAHGGTVAFVEPSRPDDRQPPRAPGACLRIELPRWQPRGALNHS